MKKIAAIILMGTLMSCYQVYGEEAGRPAIIPKSKAGYHCLFIGHSFFIPVAKRFAKLAPQSGIADHRQELFSAGGDAGSPGGLWKNPKRRAAIQRILETGKIELLGMPYKHFPSDSSKLYTLEDYRRWIDYSLKYNAGTSFFLALPWHENSVEIELAQTERENRRASKSLYRTASELRKLYPKTTFLYINYGGASIELKRLFEAGQLPDAKTLIGHGWSGVYTDRKGHASNLLKDLSALIWMTEIYGIDLINANLNMAYTTDLKPIAKKIIEEQKVEQ